MKTLLATAAILAATLTTTPSFAVSTDAKQGIAKMAVYHIKCAPLPSKVVRGMMIMFGAMTNEEFTETTNYKNVMLNAWDDEMSPEKQHDFCVVGKIEAERFNAR